MLRAVRDGLRDLIAPARCLGCLQEMTWLCRSCQAQQLYTVHILCCIHCQRPNLRGLTCPTCHRESRLTGVITAGSYHSLALQRGVHWLKFKGVTATAALLSQLLLPRLLCIAPLAQLQTKAVLVPIPLHKRRERQRGFNQSELLARELSALTDIPMVPLLERTQATWTQKKLTRDLRQANVVDAFSLSSSHSLSTDRSLIILVDDVTTTGTTLQAAAAALPAHLRHIWGATIAHG